MAVITVQVLRTKKIYIFFILYKYPTAEKIY